MGGALSRPAVISVPIRLSSVSTNPPRWGEMRVAAKPRGNYTRDASTASLSNYLVRSIPPVT